MELEEADIWKPGGRPTAKSVRTYFVLDVFTDTPLEGNQLGVFPDGTGLSRGHMQRTAREVNLAETVFLLPPQQGGDARVVIFTPLEELPFAGHPVLGTARLLADLFDRAALHLETGAGIVRVDLHPANSAPDFSRMEQPIPTWSTYSRPEPLLDALALNGSQLPIEAYTNGPTHVYVALENEAAVASLQPDLVALADLGVCVNCFAGAGTSWKTRMFAPFLGVHEDAATGSAAGPLAVHLARHGRINFGQEIEIRQGVEVGRPSFLYARTDGSADSVERVQVGGSAVVVAKGRYRLA